MDGPETAAASRGDLALAAQALRNDWPMPAAVRKRLLQSAIDIADPENAAELRPAPATRTRLAALKVIIAFAKLNLGQAALDLARERFEGGRDDAGQTDLASAVAEAEAIAERLADERGN